MATVNDIIAGALEYPVKKKSLWTPNLDAVLPSLNDELTKHFNNVEVNFLL